MTTFRSIDPATGESVWEGAAAGADDCNAAIAKARAVLGAWRGRPADERIALARRYAEVLGSRKAELSRLISRETGKLLWETEAEIASMMGKVEVSIRAFTERTGERAAAMPFGRAVLRHRGHGVMAVLGPYNFPGHLPNGHIVPALIAGNTVVFKPSEIAPAIGAAMVSAWAEAGLPEGVLNLVQGARATGEALVAGDIDGLLFTGSAGAGAALRRALVDRPHVILALELGGNNPLIWWDTDDVDAAAWTVVQSAFLTSGQRCTCARRLIVEEGKHEVLLEHLTALIDKLIVGAPFDEPQPFMGPVVGNRAADRLLDQVAALTAKGAVAIRPLTRSVPDRPFLTPALLDVTEVPHRPDEEMFGPVLQLIRVPDFSAAMMEANNTRFGLSAGLIGGDQALYDRFWSGARAGIVNRDRPTTGAASNAPVGGVGASGNHRPSAYYAADYCAFPVASLEETKVRGAITTGLRVDEA